MEEKLIYVIDDEKDIREMEKTFLENEGYLVKTFSNADDAMAAMGMSGREWSDAYKSVTSEKYPVKDRRPDLVLMDIMMPGTGGLTACSRIRKAEDPDFRALPIILVSAKDTPLDRVTGLTMGSDDYLIKPFLPLELVARVKALLRRSEILRNQLFEDNENKLFDAYGKENAGKSTAKNLNGVKKSPNVGENREKCGNLVVNYAAHRVYVECRYENEENIPDYQKENVDKSSDKIRKMTGIESGNISEKYTGRKESNGYESITAIEDAEVNGIKCDEKNKKNVPPGKNSEEINGKRIIEVQVTPMEFDFIHFLMLRKETAVSKAELLSEVWNLPDAELQEDVRMTDDLVKRLRKKLRAAGSTARVETVWGFGYRMTEN
ncbi:response regulator (CheY receiver domain and winged-helix DNA-binding domain-containing protein) [Lachnospiraceae bacterium JC7]|nr:response regulator (CheY receiver domain and winged-helix DNA-binding domain-containing protein) [Lachnospiraceae bacterium JC7]